MQTATNKAVYFLIPVQYRRAIEELKRETGRSVKSLMMESIEALAIKHGIVSEPGIIQRWPEWD